MGSSTTANVNIAWEGPGGFISTEANPVVMEAGDYTFSVTADNGCVATQIVEVVLENAPPGISLSGDDLPCGATQAQLTAVAPEAISFSWSGPNGFASMIQNPMVGVAGIYFLEIEDSNGCVNIDSFEVISQGNIPSIDIVPTGLDCDNPIVNLVATSNQNIVNYMWSGPNGFMSSDESPEIDIPGEYFVIVENADGCLNTTSVDISSDGNAPIFTLSPQLTINCHVPTTILDLVLDDSSNSVSWSDEDGFFSNDVQPMISENGIYMVEIVAANGCIAQGTVEVVADFSRPLVNVTTSLINCANDSAVLVANPLNDIVDYIWSGPNGFSSSQQNTFTFDIGNYELVTTRANGCTRTSTIVVEENFFVPNWVAMGEEISCNNPLAELSFDNFNTPPGGYGAFWLSPLDDTLNINFGIPVTTNLAGEYTLVVTSANSQCVQEESLLINIDTITPVFTLTNAVLTCEADSVELRSNEFITGSYSWVGPNGFASFAESISATQEGTYSLEITLDNGCSTIEDVVVTEDTDLPTLIIDIPFLNCFNEIDSIQTTADIDGGNYTWLENGVEVGVGPNFTVMEAGQFEVVYELPNGCRSTTVVDVEDDFIEPVVTLSGGQLNCTNPSLALSPQTNDNVTSWEWSGPNLSLIHI